MVTAGSHMSTFSPSDRCTPPLGPASILPDGRTSPWSTSCQSRFPYTFPTNPTTMRDAHLSPIPPLYAPFLIPQALEQPREVSLAVRTAKLLLAGGLAGAVARTCTAPLDRIKLLLQVQHLGLAGTSAAGYTGVNQAVGKIWREEGFAAFWKGNGVNIIRIFPYSAGQFMAHEQYKVLLGGPDGKLSVPQRLTAGAMAGMTATALTHPLDTLRLRLAMPHSGHSGMADACAHIWKKEGLLAFYKGLGATLIGIAPYAALNFASYDMLKKSTYESGVVKPNVVTNLLIGATAGTLATSVCYPLDTVRRRLQMKGRNYSGTLNAMATIARVEGIRGFYGGWWANTLKVVPQNSIRFVAYEFFKSLVGVAKAKTDT